jgi:hypothetical protein
VLCGSHEVMQHILSLSLVLKLVLLLKRILSCTCEGLVSNFSLSLSLSLLYFKEKDILLWEHHIVGIHLLVS